MTWLLVLVAAGCITEPDLKIRGTTTPVSMEDGWVISTPAAEQIDDGPLDEVTDLFFSDNAYYNAVGLIVARNGRLVFEAYARGPRDRTVPRNVQSTTKSLTSLAFGIARDEGHFPDLDRTLYSIMPEKFDADERKRAITLRHLMTMKSGIAFDNHDFAIEMLIDRPKDQVRYMLAKPMYAQPGDSFYYRDMDAQLLSSAVERVTGRAVAEIAEEGVFRPLGITNYFWESDVEGTTLGAFGLFMCARDLAKIGQLVLQRGRWENRQLVSEEWIDTSSSAQTGSDQAHGHRSYGFYWWVVPELNAFTTWGTGGNFAFVVPDRNLVIVLTSLPSTDDELVGTSLDDFLVLAHLIVGASH
jgi:CubicO group peptidase (beta-lactamase class C family)